VYLCCYAPVAFSIATDNVMFLSNDSFTGNAVRMAYEILENFSNQLLAGTTKNKGQHVIVSTPIVNSRCYLKVLSTVFQWPSTFPFLEASLLH
jgi:hypothetical protein